MLPHSWLRVHLTRTKRSIQGLGTPSRAFHTSKFQKSILSSWFKKTPQVDEQLLSILICPITKKPLRYDSYNNVLIQDEEGIMYEVHDGIPILDPSLSFRLETSEDEKS